MKNLLFTLVLMTSAVLFAQKIEIKGVVLDSLSNTGLQSATVFAEAKKDATLIAYSITDENGAFTISGNTSVDSLVFYASYQGYKEFRKELFIKDNREIDLGQISLSNQVEELEGVLVNAKAAPIRIKQDTLEFNAGSFKSKENATLEDLLEKLPGVEIDKDGTIKVNGKKVNKLLVNGKEFFGSDPKIALKNLPKEIIDKIQVTESKTEEQKILKEKSDNNEAEINVVIAEDKNKGFFSRFTAGAGTDERYSLSGIANYFNKDLRISVLGAGNNINSPGFSFDEVFDAMGSQAFSISRSSNGSFGVNGFNFGGSGDGITTSQSGGINISNDWGKKVELSANYFYGGSETISATQSRRETFLPDRSFINNSSNDSRSDGFNHRMRAELKVRPDTLTTITFTPEFNSSQNQSNSSSNSIASNPDGSIINDVETLSSNDSESTNFSGNFYVFRGTIGKKWSFSASGNLSLNNSDNLNDFNSTRNTFGTSPSTEIQNQLIDQENNIRSYRIAPKINYKVHDSLSFFTEYTYRNQNQENIRSVFDRDSGTNLFNQAQSTDQEINTLEQRAVLGGRYKLGKYRLNLSTGLIRQSLDNNDGLRSFDFEKEFTNPYLNARITKSFGENGYLSLSFRNDISLPAANQLQPAEDRTNPQNIIIGNPDLNAIKNNRVNFYYSDYNWKEQSGLYAGGSLNFVNDRVVASTITDEDLIRTTTYTNVDGVFNSYVYVSYSKSWKKDNSKIKVGSGLDVGYDENKGFTQNILFTTKSTRINPRVYVSYDIDDLLDVKLSYDPSFNKTKFDNAPFQEQDFTNQQVSIDLTTYWPKKVTFGLRGEYNKFGNIEAGFDDDSLILIGSLGYSFANDKANFKVKAYDILNQVIGTRRTVASDYVQDTNTLVLQQYFMFSFTYKLSTFTKKKSENSIIFMD
ncbi:outer membrane beta-barrel protein [Nonlabens tegetincola]|uniref:outer membrane beta-barrel protein n=1 Tax=Nonlabens tegetincola TaxID=323273 RepID=UPI0030C8C4FC